MFHLLDIYEQCRGKQKKCELMYSNIYINFCMSYKQFFKMITLKCYFLKSNIVTGKENWGNLIAEGIEKKGQLQELFQRRKSIGSVANWTLMANRRRKSRILWVLNLSSREEWGTNTGMENILKTIEFWGGRRWEWYSWPFHYHIYKDEFCYWVYIWMDLTKLSSN